MDDAETQQADVDMNGIPAPPKPAPTVVTPNASAQTPSAPAASSSSAAPAVATPTPNPDPNGLTVLGEGKRPHSDTTTDQAVMPRTRRARRQQGKDVTQWTLSIQKARGKRPMCGKRREHICD
eukprot:14142464-Alexandrium_andersonii.AAC.1